uniref:Uncharacterized protein n=1 Tax=Anguilla anguilla TaxID=7936 RepID=A0A0E9R7A6_ANGAN
MSEGATEALHPRMD